MPTAKEGSMPETPDLPSPPPDPAGTSPFAPAGQGTDAIVPPGEPPTAAPAGPPAAVDGPPAQVGRYQVAGEIARGGIGAVLRGRDPVLGRDLAIKVLLDPPAGRDPDVQRAIEQRFVEEAQIGGQLQHPGIVPVHELGRADDGRPYFTMKLVKGRTLAELLQERATPVHDLPRFLKVFEQVCQTAAYAHARGVIHRDLKPLNVMVGAFGEVQIMDWGLAKVLGDRANRVPQPADVSGSARTAEPTTEVRTARANQPAFATQAGAAWGTYAYMPPEQARGQVEDMDERCDVFALGAILCEILTGKPPYVGATAQDLYVQSFSGNLADAQARLDASGADAELLRLTRACLAVKPDDRPRDAGQVAEAVTAHLASVQERLRAAEIERAAAQARAVLERRTRRLTVGLALAVVGLGLLGGGVWLRNERDRTEAARRTQERDRQLHAELERAGTLRDEAQRASPAHQRALLADALAAAERAHGLLTEDTDAGTRERVRSLRDGLREEERDRRMVARLEEARLDADTSKRDSPDSAGPAYAAAFRDYGIDVVALPLEGAAEGLRRRPIGSALAAALDDWARAEPDAALQKRLRTLAQAADPDPERSRLREALARQDHQALKELAASVRATALPPSTLCLLAKALYNQNAAAEAEAVLRRAQVIHPGDFWVNYDLATRLEPHKPAEAIRFYSVAVALRPDSPAAHVELGNALKARGRIEEALSAYRKALELNPDYWFGLNALGLTLTESGQFDEAVTVLRKAAEFKSLSIFQAPVFAALGTALYGRRQFAEAIEALRKAVELAPNFAEAHMLLGAALSARGRHDEAAAALRQGIKLRPKDPEAHAGLAEVLLEKEDFAAAIAAFQECQAVSTKHPDWQRRSAQWIRRVKRLAELTPRAPAILGGEVRLTDPEDMLIFAYLCQLRSRRLYAASARFWEEAFIARPELAERLELGDRFLAAGVAALVGCGHPGRDTAGLTAQERARWRRQALTWLRADLALWARELRNRTPESRSRVEEALGQWQTDTDLVGLRDAADVARLPAEEQAACRALWADVAALLARARAQE
jgi:serine/threonine-protein kinase